MLELSERSVFSLIPLPPGLPLHASGIRRVELIILGVLSWAAASRLLCVGLCEAHTGSMFRTVPSLCSFFQRLSLGLFWRTLTSGLRSMGREDLDSAEQPSEKLKLQEPVRGAPGRPVVRGLGCSWSQRGQGGFHSRVGEGEGGLRWGGLGISGLEHRAASFQGLSDPLYPSYFCSLASEGIFGTQI